MKKSILSKIQHTCICQKRQVLKRNMQQQLPDAQTCREENVVELLSSLYYIPLSPRPVICNRIKRKRRELHKLVIHNQDKSSNKSKKCILSKPTILYKLVMKQKNALSFNKLNKVKSNMLEHTLLHTYTYFNVNSNLISKTRKVGCV